MGTLYIYLTLLSSIFFFEKAYGQVDDATFQLISRILEKQEEQKFLIGQQQEQLNKLTNQMTEQQTTLDNQEHLIEQLKETISRHETTITELKDELVNQKPVSVVSDNVQEAKNMSTNALKKRQPRAKLRQERFVVESEGPVAFHATVNKGEVAHIGINQKLVYETVLINLGAGYHNQHGLFIAPQSGLYLFSTSILSYVNSHSEFSASIMKNGNALANIFGHGDSGREDQGSVTVVTQLNVGDEVWVSMTNPADGSIYGKKYTSFTGILITQM